MKKGHLTIFLGMSAGVGKTYAMLEAAHEKVLAGEEILVGFVETHRRKETEALLEGLPLLPRKQILYKEHYLEEFDLEQALLVNPKTIIVDELPHSNVPGSVHPKRWNDIEDLLNAGINVFTALNIQHLESRKDQVEKITGIPIRETVPDDILLQADQVVLIDITPEKLIQRLSEGKVYLEDKVQTALNNFFREDKLKALREMALRVTAERVDQDLRSSVPVGQVHLYSTKERILTVMPYWALSENLLRGSRRIASAMNAEWYIAFIESGLDISEKTRKEAGKLKDLVDELGGKHHTVTSTDYLQETKDFIKNNSISKLIINPINSTLWNRWQWRKLLTLNGLCDFIFLRAELTSSINVRPKMLKLEAKWVHYLLASFITIIMSVAGHWVAPYIGYKAVGFLYIILVVAFGQFMTLGPILFTAIFSALIWDIFFIPPFGRLHIDHPEDIMMCVSYMIVALIVGVWTHRLRNQQELAKESEKTNLAIFEVVKIFHQTQTTEEVIEKVEAKLAQYLGGESGICLADNENNLSNFKKGKHWWFNRSKEWSVAEWSFHHKKRAGLGTNNLPSSEAHYIPLFNADHTLGILAYHPSNGLLSEQAENFLEAICSQLSLFLEKIKLSEQAAEAEKIKESEKIHQTLLNSISHEMKTPLTTILGSLEAIHARLKTTNTQDEDVNALIHNTTDAGRRLKRVIDNLLDIARVDSGLMALNRQKIEVNELIEQSLIRHKELFKFHQLHFTPFRESLWVSLDEMLFEEVLINLYSNAVQYTPKAQTIKIEVHQQKDRSLITLTDTGVGFDLNEKNDLFKKFYRGKNNSTSGTGLGLSIAKSIIELHGGSIELGQHHPQGTIVTISLPLINIEEKL